ncbi:MAG TPA: hypothetical protein PKA58_00715 [Polyangium sp.]|nr:hypothetical protein [Polyangium sp.]
MAKPEFVPSRVHIILARKAPVAIAIRRGPSKRVCTVGWDRTNDTFQVGQWIKGRIYERRCDLSPNGRHFIYFAMNGKWNTKVKGSWTAVSIAPYLKAVGLWANGSGWNGGGLFTSDKQFWLNAFPFGHQELRKPKGLEQDAFPFHESYGGECPGVYYVRLQRDGWQLMRQHKQGVDHPTIFEKQVAVRWILEKTAHETTSHTAGKGCYYDTHRLKTLDGSTVIDLPDWEWADIDGTRLVWVSGGVLHAGRLEAGGLTNTKMLFDFNALQFEALKAPY